MSDDPTPGNPIAILKEKTVASQTRLDALFLLVQDFQDAYYEILKGILEDTDDNAQVRSAVALTLGKVSGRIALEILTPHTKTENPIVRSYVLQALGMTGSEEAMPYLIAALKDEDNTVFGSASEAISTIGSPALPYLTELLKTGAHDAKCIAAWNLGEIGEATSLPSLLETIRKQDESIEVIALSIWALGQIGEYTNEVIETLSVATTHPEPEVRLRADVALKKISLQFN